MNRTAHERAPERIRSIFESVIQNGLRRDSMVGATEDDIDRYAAEQGVSTIPAAVREILLWIGAVPGLWFIGTEFGTRSGIAAATKEHAVASLDGLQHDIRNPDGALVLTAHQAYAYHLIDGADLEADDPPVWEVVEKVSTRRWNSTSAWLEDMEPIIENYREKLEIYEEGNRSRPFWADFIEPRTGRTGPSDDPRQRIDDIFAEVFADGLLRTSVSGATDTQIDDFAERQSVPQVPAAVRRILELIGIRHGLWLDGYEFGVEAVGADTKQQVLNALRQIDHDLQNPENLLVLTAFPGSDYHIIDGADLQLDDPPVRWLIENQTAREEWGSVTGWIYAMRPKIDQARRTLDRISERGETLPEWAEYIAR
ncbi:hypothetical protein SAMN04244553_2690 [Nocardia amikacinitolerans]|uniref:Knr4/Smi1-like domain-containing protein n=1 Tax=Nocardia amikacinitolerans TaxID=756689 RepID=A0A285L828_9NOCA|nr:hypothetical protein SAMN04244553_2690 [Nocardia amikacinitolerans]